MIDSKQPLHRGFDIGRQLSMAGFGCGILLLVGHLAGQIGKGAASDWSLIVGIGLLVIGLVSTLLFSILVRLDQIERQLCQTGTTGTNARAKDLRPDGA